jgi:phosphatidylglycerol:prolipoprotein diacylglycerol transferase
MSLSFYIIWNANPDIFTIPVLDHPIRWYGFMFALGFILSQQVMLWIYRVEGKDEQAVDKLTMYLVAAVVIGARLGHCLFYDPIYYLSNPLLILKVWEGGLASHGGAIGMFIALWLFARNQKISYYWILDRVVIVTCLTGACIRFGNFMNSEIIGKATNSDYGVVFAYDITNLLTYRDSKNIEEVNYEKGGKAVSSQPGEIPMKISVVYKQGVDLDVDRTLQYYKSNIKNALVNYREAQDHVYVNPDEPFIVDVFKAKGQYLAEIHVLGIVRHPAQLYEAFYCIIMFLFFAHLWYYHRATINEGVIFGVFMVMLWTLRFLDEFLKENQEAWEADIPLNMGQWLSLPMIAAGLLIIFVQMNKPKKLAK